MDAKFFDPARKEDDFKIHINRDGQWFHDGREIARDRLIKLFATALHYDDAKNEYWLITPHEQGRIAVKDAPFVILDFEYKDGELLLTDNLGQAVKPDKDNPIYCHGDVPYCTMDRQIPARINRQCREKLIDMALSQDGYNDETQTLILKANDHDHIIARA